jgi:endonuclease/exonuclease/phosphatase family metal-dependent hydrolase
MPRTGRSTGMRILTYNVHGCLGMDGRRAPERIAEVIAATRAEIACLQELDAGRERSGRVHQAEAVARALAMQFHFFPAIRAQTEQYGDAILSRWPMSLRKAEPLPGVGRGREPRGAMWVEVDTEDVRWQVLNTHFGLGRAERRVQAQALAEWVRTALACPPVVLCGDLNSRPRSRVHAFLATGLREVRERPGCTYSTRWPWICLDYLYASPEARVASAEVVVTPLTRVASDHFPLVAELVGPV